jgi:hypothetical protein
MDLNKAIIIFIFSFLVLNSIVINKQVIIALGLIVIGYYLYTNNKIVYNATTRKIEDKLEMYKNYQPDSMEAALEHIKEFRDNSFKYDRISYEKLIELKRVIMNKLYGMSLSMTGTNDEHDFFELLKKLNSELNDSIKNNYDNNKDIILQMHGDPEPINLLDKRDYL